MNVLPHARSLTRRCIPWAQRLSAALGVPQELDGANVGEANTNRLGIV